MPTFLGIVMHYLIDQRRAEIALLCRRYGVRRLEVFGSAARGTDFDPITSDADFLVDFEPGRDLPPLEQFFGLAGALERLLGRKVDMVETSAIKNPFVLAEINRVREIVYA
jgi:predicted nucleotidyltransferase